jgi:hypothetical protein
MPNEDRLRRNVLDFAFLKGIETPSRGSIYAKPN